MTDTFTKMKRSKVMSRINAKNTQPEIAVRKILYSLGCTYRLHDKKLSGKPDIVIRRRKVVIFVNGCFWHQHKDCKRKFLPKSNQDYWKKKLKFNVNRQMKDIFILKQDGWKVFVVWECQTKKENELFERVRKIYEEIKSI